MGHGDIRAGRGARGVRVTRTGVLEARDVWFANWLPLTSPTRTLLDLAGFVDAERLMLRLVREAGLPEPLVNRPFGRWRPDFHWPDQQVVAEFDSVAFHSDLRSFRRDREKSNELQLRGIVVLRFTWHELTREGESVVARLRQALQPLEPCRETGSRAVPTP
jgi:very-short-patch-repair endonuclease